jgi:hypothetical protein
MTSVVFVEFRGLVKAGHAAHPRCYAAERSSCYRSRLHVEVVSIA